MWCDDIDEIWDKAIRNARKAFYKTFEDEGYDGACWALMIKSYSISSDFDAILQTKSFDNLVQYKINSCCDKE